MPKIAVVTANRNQGHLIAAALTSVAFQDYSDWQCVVVDDGSTDSSVQMLNRIAALDRRIMVVSSPHIGVSAARNLAIARSDSDFILPLDADDIFAPGYLKAIANALSGNHYEIVSCRAYRFGLVRQFLRTGEVTPQTMRLRNRIHSSSAFRRKSFEAVGGYNEALRGGLEDWELWCRMLVRRWQFKRLDVLGLYYRSTPGSRSSRVSAEYLLQVRHLVRSILDQMNTSRSRT